MYLLRRRNKMKKEKQLCPRCKGVLSKELKGRVLVLFCNNCFYCNHEVIKKNE